MKTLTLLVVLVAMQLPAAPVQETEAPEGTTIGSAHVTGFDLSLLSPGLQEAIGALAGKPLKREHLRELADRIETEQPRFVAAVRAVLHPGGEVRVIFVVASLRDLDPDPNININTRHIVESVEITGVPESDVSQPLRDDLQALVGKRLDSDEAERLETRLKEAHPDYDVRRRIERGTEQGRIRVKFDMRKNESARWLHFEPLKSKFLYHSEQGWGGYLDLPLSGRDFRVTPSVAIDNRDDLIEEYSGFGIRVEARRIGTERLGAGLEWSTFEQTWQPSTLAALELDPGIPPAYDRRSTVTPWVTFAFTPHVRVSGGVSITELEPLSAPAESQMANAAVASIEYEQQWKQPRSGRYVNARFALRAGSDALESDLVYTQYLGSGGYRHRWGKHTVLASGMAGTITGDAPLFERFSLGDSLTLRGWNKYDIAPAGGDRMFYASLEYRYHGFAFFLDSGSVWDGGSKARIRVASGIGFHPGPLFITLGFPLNTDELSAVFTMGLRFSGIGVQNY